MTAYDALRDLCIRLEAKWQCRPVVRLACAGYADEHWQVAHPASVMPNFIVTPDGVVEELP